MVNKEKIYDELTNELGCPLEVGFKALKELAIQDKEGGVQISGISLDGVGGIYLSAINGDCYNLKDYKKTWWLKGDLSE